MIEYEILFCLLALVFIHLVADFLLQPKSWVQSRIERGIKSSKLWYHVGVHLLLNFVFLIIWADANHLPIIKYVGVTVCIGIAHLIIDANKTNLEKNTSISKAFVLDQILHLISILLILMSFEPMLRRFVWAVLVEYKFLILFYMTAYFMMLWPSSYLLNAICSKWQDEISKSEITGLEKAGQYIGFLERTLILTFILNQEYAAIGLLIAAKSIFRFGDIKDNKDRKKTEYIMIGTLSSFTIAILGGIIMYQLRILLVPN